MAQGRYHQRDYEGRLKKKDSDLGLVMTVRGETGEGEEERAMIEMSEMTSKADDKGGEDDEEEDLKGTVNTHESFLQLTPNPRGN